MGARNRDLESGCHVALITLVVVACFAGIPALVSGITKAVVHARIDSPPMHFACRSCGEIEGVREVTLDTAKHNASTISGEGFALFIALMTNKLASQPANVKEISVRLQDGSVRVFHEAVSEWREGDRVKISMGRIRPLS